MGANYKEEMKRIKERYDDIVQRNNGMEDDNSHKDELDEKSAAGKKFFQFEQENELDARSNSFRLQSYNNGSGAEEEDKDKLNTLKTTLKRFVIVLVCVSVICGTVYLASKYLAKKRLRTYVLRGNETEFEVFTGLFPIGPDELGAVSLRNVRLKGPELVKALQGYDRLTSLELENVRLEEDFNETVFLPALKDFVYVETMEKKSILDIMSGMTEPKLKSIIFFRNHNYLGVGNQVLTTMKRSRDRPEDLDLTKLWDFDVNINVTLEGYTILFMNHTREEMVLPWLTYLKREAMLENAGRGVKRLSCNRLRLSVDALHPQITHLTLRDVKLVGGTGNFSLLAKRLYKLRELRVSFGELTPVDLSFLPWKSLRHLALSRVALSHSKPIGKRAKLRGLTLLSPSFNWEVVQQFHNIFHVNELAISEYQINVNQTQLRSGEEEAGAEGGEPLDPNGLLIRNALKTEAERVYMYKFRRSRLSKDGQLERWFNATGIPKGTSTFVLDKIASQWNLRNLDWNEWSSYKHHAMGLDKLWSHSGSI